MATVCHNRRQRGARRGRSSRWARPTISKCALWSEPTSSWNFSSPWAAGAGHYNLCLCAGRRALCRKNSAGPASCPTCPLGLMTPTCRGQRPLQIEFLCPTPAQLQVPYSKTQGVYLIYNTKDEGQHELPNFCPATFGRLSSHARRALQRMRRRPNLVCAFWEQAELFPL